MRVDGKALVLQDQVGNVLLLDERHVRLRGLPTRFSNRVEKRAFADGGIQTADRTMESRDVTLEGWIVGNPDEPHLDQMGSFLQMLRRRQVDLIVGDDMRIRLESPERFDPSFIKGTRMEASGLAVELNATDPALYWYDERLVWKWADAELWSEGRANVYADAGAVVSFGTRAANLADSTVAIEPGTTNLLSANQASIETDVSGWTATDAGVTKTRITTDAHHGSASLLVATDGGAANQGVYTVIDPGAGSAGKTYTATVYVRAAAPVTVRLYLRDETNGADGSVVTPPVPTAGWVAVKCRITIGGSDSSELRLYLTSNGTAAVSWKLDAAQIEQKEFGTSFVIGTRAAGALSYDLGDMNPEPGTAAPVIVFFRLVPNVVWTDGTSSNGTAEPTKDYWLTWQSTSPGSERGFQIRVDRAAQELEVLMQPSGTLSWDYSGTLVETDEASVAVVISGDVRLYVNGVLRATLAGDYTAPTLDELLQFGKPAGPTPNARFSELVVSWNEDSEDSIPEWHADGVSPRGRRVFVYDASNAYSSAVDFVIDVPLYATVYPVLRITNEATPNLDLTLTNEDDEGRSFIYRDTGFLGSQTVVVDSQEGEITRASTNTLRFMSGSWPHLVAGENHLSYQGRDARLEFLFTPRWA